MKKLIAIICLVLVMASLLTACGKKFTCDLCQEKKSGKKHTEELLGEKITYCDECYKELKQLGDLFG